MQNAQPFTSKMSSADTLVVDGDKNTTINSSVSQLISVVNSKQIRKTVLKGRGLNLKKIQSHRQQTLFSKIMYHKKHLLSTDMIINKIEDEVKAHLPNVQIEQPTNKANSSSTISVAELTDEVNTTHKVNITTE